MEPLRHYDIVRRTPSVADAERGETAVIVENVLDLYVNEIVISQLVCSPTQMEELVLGHLVTEGIVKSLADVEVLSVARSGARARVFLSGDVKDFAPKSVAVQRVSTECGRNRVLADYATRRGDLERLPSHTWDPEAVFALAERFQRGLPLYVQTRGAHSCLLSAEGEILYVCEDIGRHNAVDKAVGCALRDGVRAHDSMLFTSGRIATDMIQKVIRSGIPVLASHSVPTDGAVELARAYGLTLLGSVTPRRMNVFSE